jgi:membrane fusion protein
MPRSLFRKEAIDAQRQKFLGEASIAQPVRGWVYTVVAVGVAAMIVAVAVWGQYTRRERVQGFLSSAVGAAVVKMPDSGVVSELMVKEGDVVKAGTPLARLTVSRAGADDARGAVAIMDDLEARMRSLVQEQGQATSLGEQQVDQARRRVSSLQEEIRQVDSEIRLQNERLESAKSVAKVWTDMRDQHQFVSPIYLQQKLDAVTEQQIRVQTVRRQRTVLDGTLTAAQADVNQAQTRVQTQREQYDGRVKALSQEREQLRQQRERDVLREMVVAAPIDGTVTNVARAKGDTVTADSQLATLLPTNSSLHAELLVPTRAIGFVHPGQEVTLRYEAFPYERFGQFHGKVESVGRSIWTSGDAVGPIAVHEPVYRIIVTVDRQSVTSGGETLPLRAGMVASADLLMEKRTLLEWLFQPVIQLRERMRSAANA